MSKTLIKLALDVLQAAEPHSKCQQAVQLQSAWTSGDIACGRPLAVPLRPARPERPVLVDPKQLKRRRLGSEAGRFALLHAIAHIELNAIDLAADMLARFALSPRIDEDKRPDFISDWVQVCADEARHFGMIAKRLQDFDGHYGDLPAHDGLWEAAISTQDDLLARLVIAPMVLEARGLDVTPGMIDKLKAVGDEVSADILAIIYAEEIAHVAAGNRWFLHICRREGLTPELGFTTLLDRHYKGALKPPFNHEARAQAGLAKKFYMRA